LILSRFRTTNNLSALGARRFFAVFAACSTLFDFNSLDARFAGFVFVEESVIFSSGHRRERAVCRRDQNVAMIDNNKQITDAVIACTAFLAADTVGAAIVAGELPPTVPLTLDDVVPPIPFEVVVPELSLGVIGAAVAIPGHK